MKRGFPRSKGAGALAYWARLIVAGLSLVGVLSLRAGVERRKSPAPVEGAAGAVALQDRKNVLPFDSLFAALSKLEDGSATEPVRILWLGDVQVSEVTFAQVVRERLQSRFGDGGVGFLSLEANAERWPNVVVERLGQFQTVPSVRESVVLQPPGRWGLAGVAVSPASDDAALVVQVAAEAERQGADWRFEWFYRPGSEEMSFEVVGDSERAPLRVYRGNSIRHSNGSYSHVHDSEETVRLRVQRFIGAPVVLGVAAERSLPGVVIDRVGIRGARVATTLAWDQEAWEVAVAQRKPALAIVAFGTDEIHEGVSSAETLESLPRLLERLQAAAPSGDCLVVGPTFASPELGRTGTVAKHDEYARVAFSKGCAYFSPWDATRPSGESLGPQDFESPVARRDGFRLSTLGYEIAGGELAQRLLRSYDEWHRASAIDGVRIE